MDALFVPIVNGTLIRQAFLTPMTALSSSIDARVVVTVAFCIASTFVLGLRRRCT